MDKKNKLLTETEIQQITNNFLHNTYFDSKIDFGSYQMATINGIQVYKLYGEISMHSPRLFDLFSAPKSANKFKFTIEVDATRGKVISYEII
jgi:hypothetical protein